MVDDSKHVEEDVRHILFEDLEKQVDRTLSVETALRKAILSQQLENIEIALGEAISANISEKRLNDARNAIIRLENKNRRQREEDIVKEMIEAIQSFSHSLGAQSWDLPPAPKRGMTRREYALSVSLEKMKNAGLHESVLKEAMVMTSRIRSEQNRYKGKPGHKRHRKEKMSEFLKKELDSVRKKHNDRKSRDCEVELKIAIESNELATVQIALLHGFDCKLQEEEGSKDLITLAMVRMQELCTEHAKGIAKKEQTRKSEARARLRELATSSNPITLRVAISEAVKMGLEKDSTILSLVRKRMEDLIAARKMRVKLGNELKQALSLIELKKRNTTEKELENIRKCIRNAVSVNVDPLLIRRARSLVKRNENYLEIQRNAVFAHDHLDSSLDYFDKNHHHIMGRDLKALEAKLHANSAANRAKRFALKCAQQAHEVAYNARLKRIWKLAREDHREEKKEEEEKEKEEKEKLKKPLVAVRPEKWSKEPTNLKCRTRVRRTASLSSKTQNQIRLVMSVDELRVALFSDTYQDLFCKFLSEEATAIFGPFETILEVISGDECSAMTIQCILRPHNDGHDEEDPIRLQELCDEQDADDEEVKSVVRKIVNRFKFRYGKTIGLIVSPRVEQILLEPRESYRSRVASLDSESVPSPPLDSEIPLPPSSPPMTLHPLDEESDDLMARPPGNIRKVSTRTLNLVSNVEHKESLIADLSKIDHSLPPGMLRRVSMGTIDVVTHLGKKGSLMAPEELEDIETFNKAPVSLAVRETRERLKQLVRRKTLSVAHAGHDGPGSGESPTEDDMNGNFGPIRVLATDDELPPEVRFPYDEPDEPSVLCYDGHWLATEGRKWVVAGPAMVRALRHAYEVYMPLRKERLEKQYQNVIRSESYRTARNFETKFLRARVSMDTIKDVMRGTNPDTVEASTDRSRPLSFRKWKLKRLEEYDNDLNECLLRARKDTEARYDPKLGGSAAWNLDKNEPVADSGELRRRLQACRVSTSVAMKQRNKMRREHLKRDLDRARGILSNQEEESEEKNESFERLDEEIREHRSSVAVLKARYASEQGRLHRVSFAQHNVRESIRAIQHDVSSIRGMTLLRPPVSGGSIVANDDDDDDDRAMENIPDHFQRRVDVRSEIQNAVDRSVLDVSESKPSSPRGGARGREFRLTKSVKRAVASTNRLHHEAQNQSIENSQLEKRLESVERKLRSYRALREALVARAVYNPQGSNGDVALIGKVKQAISRLRYRKVLRARTTLQGLEGRLGDSVDFGKDEGVEIDDDDLMKLY